MAPDVEHEDAVQQADEQPRAKRKLSRLSHMTVSKSAKAGAQELTHKSPAALAGFVSPVKACRNSPIVEDDLDDVSDDAAADPDTTASPARASQQQKLWHSSPSPAAEPADALVNEIPAVTPSGADSQQHRMQPEPTAVAAAADAPSSAAPAVVGQPHRVNLDDEEDDEWEDQPAPMILTTADAADAYDAAQAEAAASEAQDAAAPDYDPSNRRRKVYDDEDEWEELVIKEKFKGTQQGSGIQQEADEEAAEQQGSVSNSGSDDENEDDILGAEDDTNAATQRLLRDSALRDGLGKGFKPEVAPLNSLLGKLAARQAALEAKAKQRAPPVEQEQQTPLTLEQLKAHLEQHSIGSKHQHKQSTAADQPAAAGAGVAAEDGQQQADADMDCDIDLEDGSDDDLTIEPAQAAQPTTAAAAAGVLPLDTQQLLDELPPLQERQPHTAGVAQGSEVYAGTATELDLQLGDDADEQADEGSKGSQEVAELQDGSQAAGDSSGDEGEADGSDGEEDEEMLDSSEIDGSGSESEDADSEQQQQQQSEDLAEPEPLHWEEEEAEGVAPSGSSQQEAAADGGDEDAQGAKPKSSKGFRGGKARSRGAAGGFIEAEADLSDEEGAEDEESDYEGDEEDDAMLAELINEVKEGRMDEARRADLHAKWMAGKDAKEMRDLLDALKRGFKKKRKAGAGLDSDEEDGTDAAARRRRAQLLGTLDDEEDVDAAEAVATDRLKRLDFQWQEEEQDMVAAAAALTAELSNREKQKKVKQLQLQASESQDGTDVMQLLQMDWNDEDSQHTAALLSKSASAPAAVPVIAGAGHGSGHLAAAVPAMGHSMPAQVRLTGSKLRQQTGPDRQPGSTGTATAGSKVGGVAGGFTFQMFGKDLTNSSKQPAGKQQVAGSFIGRQASNSVTVRAASNYGASRSFVFGSDPSNYSNPAAKEHPADANKAAAAGPSNFAGLSKLIAESRPDRGSAAAAGGSNASGFGQGGVVSASQDASLLSMLGNKKGSGSAVGGSSKLHLDAVGTKFKAVGNSRGGDSNAGASRGGPWQF